ncbi:hypothetical protein C8Q72DRAFT_84009 [Fomitopsis betulina]|nr:hypothetical protein C8Q72DRAFT_84009 [Fomitopsis betulina]
MASWSKLFISRASSSSLLSTSTSFVGIDIPCAGDMTPTEVLSDPQHTCLCRPRYEPCRYKDRAATPLGKIVTSLNCVFPGAGALRVPSAAAVTGAGNDRSLYRALRVWTSRAHRRLLLVRVIIDAGADCTCCHIHRYDVLWRLGEGSARAAFVPGC